MKKKLVMALIVALSAQGMETVYAQDMVDTVKNGIEVEDSNHTSLVETNKTTLKVTTEGKGSVSINGQTLTGGDVSVKTGESVRVKVKPAEGYKVDKVQVNGIVL
ncbi:cell wall anchor protein, partial [Clostridium perfringens]|nr:cell wall anchor protein [Clostridium perfringens]